MTQTVITVKGKPHIDTVDVGPLPVRDAKHGLELTIAKEAVRYGKRHGTPYDKQSCFFALGLMKDETTGVIDARITTTYSYLRFANKPREWVKFVNPREVRDFIRKFDATGSAVALGTVELHLAPVPPSKRQGYRVGRTGPSGKRTITHATRHAR